MIKREMIVVLALLIGSFAVAEDAVDRSEGQEAPKSFFAIGGGAVFSDSYYKDEDTRVIPIPNIIYMSEEYYLTGLTAGKWLLGDQDGFKLAAQIGGRLEYVDDSESDYYDGIDSRYPTLEAGLKAEYPFLERYTVSFEGMADVLSEHDGYELSLKVSEEIPAIFGNEKLSMKVSAGLSWRSKNLNDYYFGIDESEARAGRPAYEAGGGLNYQFGTSLTYRIDDRWSWFNMVGIEFASDEITDSPMVEDHETISFITGLSYKL